MRFACLGLVTLILAATVGCGPKEPPAPVLKQLKITDTKVGDGPKAEVGDKVIVQYVGKLQNGKQFDASMDSSKPPLNAVLGFGQVIKGWDDGLVGMRVGGERDLAVPASLGYGDQARGENIPANSALYFHVKLIGVLKRADAMKIASITDDTVGTGPAVQRGNTVTIKYTATYLNGCDYDQSDNLKFEVGEGWVLPDKDSRVVAGLNKGVVGMKKGGKRTLVLPPALSQVVQLQFEDQTVQPLKFEVTLLDVQ